MARAVGWLLAVVVATWCTPVAAADVLGPGNHYSIYTLGPAQISNANIQGAIAVGGSASISSVTVGPGIPNSWDGDPIVVGGDLNLSNSTVLRGDVRAAGSISASGARIVHGSLQPGSDLAAFFDVRSDGLHGVSGAWAGMEGNASPVAQWGTLTLAGENPELNIFHLGADAFEGVNSLRIDVPKGATVLVNVAGREHNLRNFGVSLTGVSATSTLFNFSEAALLTIGGVHFEGSILAPRADVAFANGNFSGTLVANTLVSTGSFKYAPFAASMPAVPEPSAAALLIVMAAALRLWRAI